MNRRSLRNVLVIARTDLRVGIRSVLDQPRLAIGWTFGGLFFLGLTGFAFLSSIAVGGLLLQDSGGLSESALESAGLGVVATFGVGAYLAFASVFEENPSEAVDSLLRTSMPISSIVAGRLLSNILRNGLLLVLPLFAAVAGLGIGARSISVTGLGVAGTAILLGTGYVLGHLASVSLRYLTYRVTVSRWLRVAIQGIIWIAVFAGVFWIVVSDSVFTNPIVESVAGLGAAYVNVLLAPIGGTIQPVGVGILLASLVSLVVGGPLLVRIETALLALEQAGNEAQSDVTRTVPVLFDRTPATRTAWHQLLRTVRDPRLLSHLGMVLMYLVIYFVFTAIDFSVSPVLVTAALFVTGVLVAGGAYCLNPLGDDRPQRPLLLTSTNDLTRELHGRALAGIVLGTAISIGIGLPVALITGAAVSPVGLLVLSTLLLFASVGTALGFGALLPKYKQSEYMNVERIHPSLLALFAHEIGGAVVAVSGFGLLYWSSTAGIDTLALVSWTVYLAVVGVFGLGGYLYARRRIAGQTMEQ